MGNNENRNPNLIWVGRPLAARINKLEVREDRDGRVIALRLDVRVDDDFLVTLPSVMMEAIQQEDLDLALTSGKFTQEGGQIGFTLSGAEREFKCELATLKPGLNLKLGSKPEDRMRPDIQISLSIPYSDPAIRFIGAHLCELLTLKAWTAASAQETMDLGGGQKAAA